MSVFCGIVRKFAAELYKQGRMNRFITRFCALAVGALLLSSCLGDDDDDYSVYGDMAITGFTLGTLNRYTAAKTSSGNDTIIKTTLNGSSYKMTIDHIGRRIYNVTMLPKGTDISHVVCNVTAKNSSLIALQSMTDETQQWFSNTDSIDFSEPRVFWAYATDGSGGRSYTVELNVSATTGIEFDWELEKTDADLAGWTDKRLVAYGDTVRLEDADSIIGTSTNESYKLGDDERLFCLRDSNWQEEALDDSAELLPQSGHTVCISWPYTTAAGADYVLMVGTPRQEDEAYMRVWRKICLPNVDGRWTYMPFDDGNYYRLPRQEWLSMAYYNGAVLAVGSDMQMRQSRDQGISWKQNSTYDLPSELKGTKVTMAADNLERLWLLTNEGQLWRGSIIK